MTVANLIIFLILAVMSPRLLAHSPQEGKVLATPAVMAYRTRTSDPAPSSKSPYRLGGGLISELDLNDSGGVEFAFLYQEKYYLRDRGHDLAVEKIKRMYITTGYRYWPFQNASAALAVYSSYSMGDPRIVYRESLSQDRFITSARDITEYGLDFSLQWEIWNHEAWTLLSDVRYSWSLTRKSKESADLYGLLIGLKYEIPKSLISAPKD